MTDENKKLKANAEYEKYILEVLPRENRELQTAFAEAAEGKRHVMLVTKGFRPMYKKNHPHGFNYFFFTGTDPSHIWPVPTICKLAGVNPSLVQDAYFHLRNHERWPRLRPELDEEILEARYQAVTNLFPFPEIEWRRESGATGEIYHLCTTQRKPPFLSEEEIRNLAQPGKAIENSYLRNIRHRTLRGRACRTAG